MVFNYPLDGKGGVGFTYCQPITESMIMVDSWPELGGAYVFVDSCKMFNPWDLIRKLLNDGYLVDLDQMHYALQGIKNSINLRENTEYDYKGAKS